MIGRISGCERPKPPMEGLIMALIGRSKKSKKKNVVADFRALLAMNLSSHKKTLLFRNLDLLMLKIRNTFAIKVFEQKC